MPNHTYLRIHAECSTVAHLSFADDCMEKTLNDLENHEALCLEMVSADVLSIAL